MSWLSLCLDSADRQISGGNACDGIRASAAVAPICQSTWMRAGRPAVLQIMSVLVPSPLLLFIHISFCCSTQQAALCSGREKWSNSYSPPAVILHFLLEKHSCIMFSIGYERLSALVFRCLCSTHCHTNASIIIYFSVCEASSDLWRLDVCVIRVAHSLSLSFHSLSLSAQ